MYVSDYVRGFNCTDVFHEIVYNMWTNLSFHTVQVHIRNLVYVRIYHHESLYSLRCYLIIVEAPCYGLQHISELIVSKW